MTKAVLILGGCILLTQVFGCGGPSDYKGNVTISVDTDGTPSFSWSPECKVYILGVETTGWDIGDVWLITSEEGFGPGVRYGEVPNGAVEVTTPYHQPLYSGREYVVFVYNDPDGLTDYSVESAGFQKFTP